MIATTTTALVAALQELQRRAPGALLKRNDIGNLAIMAPDTRERTGYGQIGAVDLMQPALILWGEDGMTEVIEFDENGNAE